MIREDLIGAAFKAHQVEIEMLKREIARLRYVPIEVSDFLKGKISPEAFKAFEKHVKQKNEAHL